jgi:GNAT superfamily N-acetyltransferase
VAPPPAGPLDHLAARLVGLSPLRFAVADGDGERAAAYRLRGRTVASRGWAAGHGLEGGVERDEFDADAVVVIGWEGATAMAAGRLVLPPGPLPTEQACGLEVEPVGEVVDVGRMVVSPEYQDPGHGAFVALLCRLYLEMRARGYVVACGMMSPSVRALSRQLGLHLELLGPDRPFLGEDRAPVRFAVAGNGALPRRWSGSAQGEASTSEALAPPKPNELLNP